MSIASFSYHSVVIFRQNLAFRLGKSITTQKEPFIFAILRGTKRISILRRTRKWYFYKGAAALF